MIFDGDRDALSTYVRELADLMGLKDWAVHVTEEHPDRAGALADINVIYGRRCAYIRMAKEWARDDPEELRNTIAHELIHCHLNHIRNVADNVQSIIGDAVYRPLYNAITDYVEFATDSIATAWAERLPLPTKQEQEAA